MTQVGPPQFDPIPIGEIAKPPFVKLPDPGDRRVGVGGDFHQIHAMIACKHHRIAQQDDPQLAAIHADDANLAGADFPVDPDK